MRSVLILLFSMFYITAFAQEKAVTGIVFDRDTKDRIAIVKVLNLTNGTSIYNKLTGEFKIPAVPGDVLVFTRQEYYTDTVRVINNDAMPVYMKRSSILLKQVDVTSKMIDPLKRLQAEKELYSKAYGPLANREFLTFNSGTAGLSIDALYNLFSRSGHDAKRLRETIDNEYLQNVIDYRFNKTFVGGITGLKEKQLDDFMLKYRPGYYFLIYASDYELIASIRTNLARYQRNPRAHGLEPLITPK